MNNPPRIARRRFDSSTFEVDEAGLDGLPQEPLPADDAFGETIARDPSAPVVLIPIGRIDDTIIKGVVPIVEAALGHPLQVAKGFPEPKFAFNPTRGQYHSAAILKRVETMMKGGWDSAIGICDVDLFVPEVPFIFGEADRSTRAAVVSLSRLRPELGNPDTRLDVLCRRLGSEFVHQLGLIRGLAHCPNNRCVMFLSASVQDTDKRGTQFCANCRKRLSS